MKYDSQIISIDINISSRYNVPRVRFSASVSSAARRLQKLVTVASEGREPVYVRMVAGLILEHHKLKIWHRLRPYVALGI